MGEGADMWVRPRFLQPREEDTIEAGEDKTEGTGVGGEGIEV